MRSRRKGWRAGSSSGFGAGFWDDWLEICLPRSSIWPLHFDAGVQPLSLRTRANLPCKFMNVWRLHPQSDLSICPLLYSWNAGHDGAGRGEISSCKDVLPEETALRRAGPSASYFR